MKLVYTDGCICTDTTINNKQLSAFTKGEKLSIFHKIIPLLDNDLIEDFIRQSIMGLGEYEFLYHCEECGDSVCKWTLDIKDNDV